MSSTSITPKKENRTHGTPDFPCAYYLCSSMKSPWLMPFFVKHHWHDEIEILYFRKGSFTVEINMEKIRIQEECLLFLNSGEFHSIYCDVDYEESAVLFSPSMLSFAAGDAVQTTFIQPLMDNLITMPRILSSSHPLFPALYEEYEKIADCFSADSQNIPSRVPAFSPEVQLKIKISLFQILFLLASHNLLSSQLPSSDHRIETIKKSLLYMKEHYREKIYLRDLAGQVNLNTQYYCRFFKKIIGKTPLEYLNELRLREAMHLLTDTDLPVTDICLQSGFNNLGNFIRSFKEYSQYTPLQFRKISRNQK